MFPNSRGNKAAANLRQSPKQKVGQLQYQSLREDVLQNCDDVLKRIERAKDCNGSDRTARQNRRQSSYRKYPKLNRVNSILKK